MKRESVERALQATARIACCASLITIAAAEMGCRTADKGADPLNEPNDDTSVVEPSDTDAPEPSDTQEPSEPSDTDSGTDPLAECEPVLDAAFPPDSTPSENPSAELVECCALTARYYDELAATADGYDFQTFTQWVYSDQCCYTLDYNMHCYDLRESTYNDCIAAAGTEEDCQTQAAAAYDECYITGCTPWGPPVPPTMKRKVVRAALAARALKRIHFPGGRSVELAFA